jgi:hypothetical protein
MILDAILSETPIYKFYMQRTLELALEEVTKKLHEEGHKEGVIEGLRQGLLIVFQARFPKLGKIVQKRFAQIEDHTLLEKLLVKASSAQTIEDALDILVELDDLDGLEE